MNVTERIITICFMALAVIFTRAIAFVLFPAGKQTPHIVRYLGKVLPLAVFGMLVVYCLKDIEFSQYLYGIPEIAGMLATAVVHALKRQMFLSIAIGTAVYMVLICILIV